MPQSTLVIFNQQNKPLYPHGNYPYYYSYRRPKGEKDSRFKVLRYSWFAGKKCLDIGCNVGNFTRDIAFKYDVSKIVGVDIDEALIKRARMSLAKRLEYRKPKIYPISFEITLGKLDPLPSPEIEFRHADFLEYEDTEKYGVITCFSTSKWIHLNAGDEGIKKFFAKVYELLEDGGLFVFEPQLWNSYKKKASLTPEIKKVYKSIKLEPKDFKKYLIENTEFKLVRELVVPRETRDNFERPVLLLEKPK